MLPRQVNRRIGRAMHTYSMLADGDNVLVAVSGGVDSLFLAWLLNFWQRKAPISYTVQGVHVDMAPDDNSRNSAAEKVRRQLAQFGVECTVIPAAWQPDRVTDKSLSDAAAGDRDICYTCARNRRTQLFDFARRLGCSKIALGHHRDDIIETFMLNICYAGNISTMVPRQDLFSGRLSLIRPLAYLDKEEIVRQAEHLGLEPVRTYCPLSEKTKRREVRHLLNDVYRRVPEAKERIFASLGNVRYEYLLKPGRGADRNGEV